MNDVALLSNHLAFLRRHRGEITETPSGYAILSSRAEFTYAIALRDEPIDPSFRAVHRPEFGAMPAGRLEADGFRRVGALRYMTRPTAGAVRAVPADMTIHTATTRADADDFALAQTHGFFDRDVDQAEWLPYMSEVARRNVSDPAQTLLIARVEGLPAGATLTVETDVIGVYAVATPERFRRRGIATALLEAALRRAAQRGVELATLQVAVDSNAERLYSNLGFTSRFVSEIWKRD